MENKPEFQGRALDFEEQIALLRSQGLIIEDEKKALHILNNVSYKTCPGISGTASAGRRVCKVHT